MSLHTGLVQAELTNASVQIAAQNVSATGPGAYTGEVSAAALKDSNIGWTITGHSERRDAGETSAQMAAKTKAAVAGGLKVKEILLPFRIPLQVEGLAARVCMIFTNPRAPLMFFCLCLRVHLAHSFFCARQ